MAIAEKDIHQVGGEKDKTSKGQQMLFENQVSHNYENTDGDVKTDEPEMPKFENPSNVKVATWETIKEYAESLFNYWTNGGDLKWAQTAWRFIEKTPLSFYSDTFEYYRVMMRLFALADLYGIYANLGCNEDYKRNEKYSEWVDETGLNKLKILLISDKKFQEDEYVAEVMTDYQLIMEPIDELIEEEYDKVVDVLIKGFGSNNSLIRSLEKSASVRDEEEEEVIMDEDELKAQGYSFADVEISENTYHLIEWNKSDFSRDYLGTSL